MRYKYIFFDLDGTLTDSKEGIINSIKYALDSIGAPMPEGDAIMRFLGPPLIYSFREFCGLDEARAAEAVEKYRERFADIGIFENRVYDGVYDMLKELTGGGRVPVLATSKPRVYAERIMIKFRLRPYFKLLCGSELDGTRNEKCEVIKYALKKLGCPKEKVIMVGDREQDILGAKKCGVASCGAGYGYAAPGELEAAGAGYIANTVDELTSYLMK